MNKINKSIEEIESFIKDSGMIEYENEEEYIQEKINEGFEN